MARSRRIAVLIASALACTFASPALANSSAAEYFRNRANSTNVPELLSKSERDWYKSLFSAIDAKDWTRVDAMFAEKADGPLHQVARAEYFLDAASPKVELPAIEAWLSQGTSLPQAEQIANLGLKRGLTAMPGLPAEQRLVPQGYAPRRVLPSAVDDGTMPATVKAAILERIKNDDPSGARVLLDGVDASLSSAARAEWRQRVAWSYYIENQDAAALAMANTVREGGSGAWVGEGDWAAGLAAWRLNDCAGAADAFQRAALSAQNPELNAAAYYWASRANVRCRQPEKAAEQLRGAARMDETLYGMLAREALGQELPGGKRTADFDLGDWQRLRDQPNVRTAVALSEIGRDALADEVLRHEARIGPASEYDALSRLARELGLPSTQLWMSANAPRGARAEYALRYPAPRWQPSNGWKVDPALAFAHALQESRFQAGAVSPAGARGLMQIMPAAAKDHSGSLGYSGSPSDLNKPEVNLAFGQRHLSMLRDSAATGGLLPKIMAAYNAGLSPITRWNSEINDQGDPLLYMESIPYWETRGYVGIVMRNYWMYERQAGVGSESRKALAQGMWPTFPELSGARAVRLSSNR
ncbi:Soluble lytic murein transglycosylase precursor [Tsuneonella dongtanensis]|uniref:Soluble lytic murein transglycosylase n=1 Tax=Tsuneonella dongtanensis TaxID=692370 RepID=A0A1B2AF61_9SPHN|nr:lytic transglycosylase domain-containing protein [Tsuneonella dongtanensis]ANY20797.1 Soluble lytic murein transglycosylase precursor [Tsuneonella dongtanensis]